MIECFSEEEPLFKGWLELKEGFKDRGRESVFKT